MEDFIDQLIFNFTVQAEAHLYMIWSGIVILFAWKMKRSWTFLIASFLTLFGLLILGGVFLHGWWNVLYGHDVYKIAEGLGGLRDFGLYFCSLLIFTIIVSVCSLLFYLVFYSYRKRVLSLQKSQTGTSNPKCKIKLRYRITYALILVLLFFIFLSVGGVFYYATARQSRTSYTCLFLHELAVYTWDSEGESFEEKLAEQTKNSDQSLWENFSNLLQKKGFFTKEEFDRKFGKDLWGNPYNIDYTTNLTGLPENLSEYLGKYPIVIWSNGRNRINERCLGDDIFWPTHTPYFNPYDHTYRNLLKSKTNLVYQPTAENETINQN